MDELVSRFGADEARLLTLCHDLSAVTDEHQLKALVKLIAELAKNGKKNSVTIE
jgi:hypothetical protein